MGDAQGAAGQPLAFVAHVKVHLGEAGTRNGESVIYVKGSPGDIENCESYANG